jgi:exopolysaccharide biosynthesis polyprenyl glycosylphosphotransferase
MSKTERRKGEARLQALLVTSDLVALLAAMALAYVLRFYSPLTRVIPVTRGVPPFGLYVAAAGVLAAIWVPTLAALGLYRPRLGRGFATQFARVAPGVLVGALLGLALTFFYRAETFSRLTFALFLPLALIAIPLFRAYLVMPIARRIVRPSRVAVAGSGETARMLAARLWAAAEESGSRFAGRFGDDRAPVGETVGTLAEVVAAAKSGTVDRVLVALDLTEAARGVELMRELATHPVEVEWVPDVMAFAGGRMRFGDEQGVPVLVLGDFPLLGWNGALKRAMDVTLAGAGLAVLSPALTLLAILVKLSSPGPVLYRQLRVGRDGRRFEMLKFRTMRPDSEVVSGPIAAQRNDPRVTAIGRWLRRLSLDELPQLVNVVRGEMSLVGPRPERPVFIGDLAEEIPEYLRRLRVKSGMTGWAQIHGLRGGESSMADRVRADLYYIENWSVALDLEILFRTVFTLHRQRNAY